MHEQIETAQRLTVARFLPNNTIFIENHFVERGKSSHKRSQSQEPLSGRISHAAARGFRLR
jgi:hypothetical protein